MAELVKPGEHRPRSRQREQHGDERLAKRPGTGEEERRRGEDEQVEPDGRALSVTGAERS